jgi:hypothetical protein
MTITFTFIVTLTIVWGLLGCGRKVARRASRPDMCVRGGGRGSHFSAPLYSAMWTGAPCGHIVSYAHPQFRFLCFLPCPLHKPDIPPNSRSVRQLSATNWLQFSYWPEDGSVVRPVWHVQIWATSFRCFCSVGDFCCYLTERNAINDLSSTYLPHTQHVTAENCCHLQDNTATVNWGLRVSVTMLFRLH